MDFASVTQSAFSEHLPHVGCLSDEVDLSDNEAPSFEPQASDSDRTGIRLRLPPYYVLQAGEVRSLGTKAN